MVRPTADGLLLPIIISSIIVDVVPTERPAEAGIEPSVGSLGDSDGNALAESVIGRFKTPLIRPRGPWCSVEDVESATLEWVWWFKHHRLQGPIGYVPPAEFEEAFYRRRGAQGPVAALT